MASLQFIGKTVMRLLQLRRPLREEKEEDKDERKQEAEAIKGEEMVEGSPSTRAWFLGSRTSMHSDKPMDTIIENDDIDMLQVQYIAIQYDNTTY